MTSGHEIVDWFTITIAKHPLHDPTVMVTVTRLRAC